MSIFENPENLRLLQQLLNPQLARANDSDTDEDEEAPLMRNNFGPGSIGPKKTQMVQKKQKEGKQPAADAKKPTINSIEEWQEMQEKEDRDVLETRKCPEYKITYCQAVGTEDIFLGLGNRTNASASCEDMLLHIELPEETIAAEKMDLTITSTDVDLATPVYRLRLPLPHKVNVDRCSAKYEADAKRLCLKLRMEREFDYVNF